MKFPKITPQYSRKIGLAVLSGILSIFILPPYNIELIAWIVFVPLFVAIQQESPKNAFWLGWGTGVIHFLGTLYWVTVAMAIYGKVPKLVSGAMLVLLAVYLALYIGTFCMVIRYLQRKTVLPLIVSAPVTWVGLEYLRSFFIIGFPWNSLGYCQFLNPYVTQIAEITGVYGVSFLIVLVNSGIYSIVLTESPRQLKIKIAGVTLCCVMVWVGYSLFTLAAENNTNTTNPSNKESSETVRVAVVQGNIDQAKKWDRRYRQEILDKYIRLSSQILDERPELIVWPETAIPFVFRYEPDYRKQLVDAVRELGISLLSGGQDIIPAPSPKRYNSLNSAFFLSSEGNLLGQYDKIHLVPFGEYIPYKKLLFFVDKLVTAIGEVLPGKTYTVMPFQEKSFSVVICFEIIFPNLVRKFVDRGARFLVTITNDAWYGRTAAPYQHFAMVTFRAIENRVPIARSANTGISGFFDPYGRILEQSEIFVDDTLVQDLPLRNRKTFYTRYGDVFAGLCLVILVGWIVYGFSKNRYFASKRLKVKKE